jgi:ribonuclease BN (tRNA processing enzyme)
MRRFCLALAAASLGGLAIAQERTTPPKGMRLVTLGTRGGPSPTIHRAQSSNLLIVNGANYVIDAGDGVSRRLTRFGANFRAIDHIFITHAHSDHTSGLASLLSNIYDALRTTPVAVHGPSGTKASVDGLVQYLNVSSEIRISDGNRTVPVTKIFSGRDVAPGVVFQDANVKVTAVGNSHFHFPPGSPGVGRYDSFSYRFDTPDRSIVFTGDTGPSDAVCQLAKGVDILVSEIVSIDELVERQKAIGRWQAMSKDEQAAFMRHQAEEHLEPHEVAKLATCAGAKTVVLTHLSATVDPKDEYARFITEVKKGYAGDVKVAKDLAEF